MKLKSLLFGSAAALVAVSGARAADAVVIPEPEAVEYVRVCDAAGTGYFYIPGTETCLRISGFVRYQMDFAGGDDYIEYDDLGAPTPVSGTQDGWDKEYNIRLGFEAWNDTELGPLYSHIRFYAGGAATDRPLGDGTVMVDRAYFTLAGVTMGFNDTFWDIGFGGPADIYNNYFTTTGMVAYTANVGDWAFTVSLEDDGSANWMPSVVGVASGSIGSLGLTLAAVYDDTAGATGGGDWSLQGAATYEMGKVALGAGFQYSGAPGTGNYQASYDWVIGGDASIQATDKLNLGIGTQYAINELGSSDDDWALGAIATYEVVSGLETELRIQWMEDTYNTTFDTTDSQGWNARLRFTRSF
ncbi:MAG: porin [Oricola sp.]